MSQNKYYPMLFKKGKIGNVTIKNRIVRNTMGTYLGNPDGSVSSRQIEAYAEAARGGAGLVFMDNVVPVTMTSCGLRADEDRFIAGLSQLADAVKNNGAAAGMQIAHPGRDAGFVGSDDVIGASPITYEPWYQAGARLPRQLTIDEIHDLIHKFGDAALRVKRAGFQIIELHAAAGCIPTNFLSPHDNHRTDMYGGSLENRMRFLLECVMEMKKKCGPDFPVGVKLSTEDWEPEGIRIDETIEVAKALEKIGCSHINLMGGTHATSEREFILPDGFNLEYDKKIKESVHIPVFCGHNIFTPEEAEKALEDGCGDFVTLGRAELADVNWPNKAKEGKAEDICPCINCMIGCIDRGLLSNTVIHCTVNPSLYRFERPVVEISEKPENVAVVGAGPAGCEAAITAAAEGHHVTIYEKNEIGGAMIEASVPEHKANIRRLIAYYKLQLRKNNVNVIQKEADFDTLKKGGYDAVIIACGGIARQINVPGAESDYVIYAMDYLGKRKKAGGEQAVVIGGGITGAETALQLREEGKNVTIVEMADRFLGNPASSCRAYLNAISNTDIQVLTSLRLEAVKDHKAVLVDRFGNHKQIPADTIVIAAGFVPQKTLAEKLDQETDMDVFNIGDAEKVAQIYDAVHAGYAAARSL